MNPNMAPDEKVKMGFCPITNSQDITDILKIRKWNFYLITMSTFTRDVPVSAEGKKIHEQSLGVWWQIFDPVGNICMYIPFIGFVLAVVFFVYVGIFLSPLWAIIDLVQKRKIFGRGALGMNSDGVLSTRLS